MGSTACAFRPSCPSDARIRTRGLITDVVPIDGGYQVHVQLTTEVENVDKPTCVAEVIVRYLN